MHLPNANLFVPFLYFIPGFYAASASIYRVGFVVFSATTTTGNTRQLAVSYEESLLIRKKTCFSVNITIQNIPVQMHSGVPPTGSNSNKTN